MRLEFCQSTRLADSLSGESSQFIQKLTEYQLAYSSPKSFVEKRRGRDMLNYGSC